MKKTVLLIAAIGMYFGASAQLMSKKGEPMLPQEGDYALGFSATPVLNYVGNFFSLAGNTAPTASFATNDMSIIGKKFMSDDMAYRFRGRVGFANTQTVMLNGSDQDKFDTSYVNITLGGGPEWRHGNTRIQGFCGVEGLVSLSGSRTDYDYESDLQAGDPDRVVETRNGTNFGFGARGFVGAEVFVFPKTSIAFEYGYGLRFSTMGNREVTTEDANGDQTTTRTQDGGYSIGLDNDINGGSLTLIFHF